MFNQLLASSLGMIIFQFKYRTNQNPIGIRHILTINVDNITIHKKRKTRNNLTKRVW